MTGVNLKKGWWRAALAGGLIWLWWQLLDERQLVLLLAQVKPFWIAVSVLLLLVNFILSSYRLRLILAGKINAPFAYLLWLNSAGAAASLITPANSGGLLRAWLLKRRFHQPFKSMFASILLDHLFAGVLGILIGPVLVLGANQRRRRWLAVSGLSSLIIFISGVSLKVLFLAFGYSLNLGGVILAQLALALANFVALTPAALGQYELSGLLILSRILAVNQTTAATVVVVNHALSISLILGLTLVFNLTRLGKPDKLGAK